MKKLISLALALVMILSLSTVVFAADYDEYLDKSTSFTKEYDVKHGEAPAETFEFKAEFVSFKDNEGEDADMEASAAPKVTLGDAAFDAIAAGTSVAVDVQISDVTNADLGVYTYEITEVAGKTAGVTYNDESIFLVVTVLRDDESTKHYVAAVHYETENGEKTGKITNEYDAGQLTVTKEITGNMADMSKQFIFTITLTAPEGSKFADNQNVCSNDGAEVAKTTNSEWIITVPLGDGESINITNIPVGTTYTVEENADGYTSTHTTAADGSIAGGDADVDVWTNELTSEVDTGIALDSMPYVLILAVVAGAFVLATVKKREV